MLVRVPIHAPPHRLPVRAWTGRPPLLDEAAARGQDPDMSFLEISHEDVEVG